MGNRTPNEIDQRKLAPVLLVQTDKFLQFEALNEASVLGFIELESLEDLEQLGAHRYRKLLAMELRTLELNVQTSPATGRSVESFQELNLLFEPQDTLSEATWKSVWKRALGRVFAGPFVQGELLDFRPSEIGKVPFAIASMPVRIDRFDIGRLGHGDVMRDDEHAILGQHDILLDEVGSLRMR